MPVTIAGGKIHSRIHFGGVFRQLRIDQADRFKKIFPVQGREQAHARDDVADSDLRRGLALMLFADDLFDRETFFGKLFFYPLHGRHYCRILFAQALRELHHKGAAERFASRHARSKQRQQLVWLALCLLEQFVGEAVGCIALGTRHHDARGQAAQILYQGQTQTNRHRPQLANRKRRDFLVGIDEPAQRFGIKVAVSVGDKLNGKRINARVLSEVAGGELGQLVVITLGQVFANLTHLLFHDMKVVDQPLSSGRDDVCFADGFGQRLISGDQLAPILFQTRQQQISPLRLCRNLVFSGERGRVLLEPLDAVQLFADRQLGAALRGAFESADQS